MRPLRLLNHLGAAAMVLAVAAPARAELRISDLDVFLNDHEVTVHVVLLGVVPGGLHEGIQSGIPAHVRLDIELWQYQRVFPDRLLVAKTVERTLTYNVVTREFKVAALQGEARPAHTTRDLRDAQRILSDIRERQDRRPPERSIPRRSSTCASTPPPRSTARTPSWRG